MALLLHIFLISFAVSSAFAAPTEDEVKLSKPKIELVQAEDTNHTTVDIAEDLNDRILKGLPAQQNAFPFAVSLQMQHPHAPRGVMHKFCGGSIITDRVVLTAAHCFDPAPTTPIYVSAGRTNAFDVNAQRRSVAQIAKHPCYGQKNPHQIPHLNDIALLILAEPLQLSQSVQPIFLATESHSVEATGKGQVLGWGATHKSDHSQSSSDLLYKDIDVIDPIKCSKYFRVHSHVICVSNGDNSEAGPCVGDSGGPFIQKVGNKPLLAGLTSYGSQTCGEIPTIYTRISKYRQFIDDVIKGRPISSVCA